MTGCVVRCSLATASCRVSTSCYCTCCQVFIGNSLVSFLHKLLLHMLSGVHWQQPRVIHPQVVTVHVVRCSLATASCHSSTSCYCTCCQVFIGNSLVSILHKLEQVSSDEHIGSLAENLMETLKDHPEIAAKVCSSAICLVIRYPYLIQSFRIFGGLWLYLYICLKSMKKSPVIKYISSGVHHKNIKLNDKLVAVDTQALVILSSKVNR